MNSQLKGYAYGAIAAAAYGTNPIFARPLYDDGMTPDSVLFMRYAMAIPIVGLMLAMRGKDFRVTGWRNWATIAFMGFLMAVSSLTLFLSYNEMNVGIASTLLFFYPILVALIMAGVYHERLQWVTVISLVLALCGIGLLYKGEDGATLSLWGTSLVMMSALSYALYIVGINQTSLHAMPTLKITFWVLIFGLMLFVVTLTANPEKMAWPQHWYMWGNLLGLAVFPTTISFICTAKAIQNIGSTAAAILGALEPVTAVILGILILGERVTGREVLGMVLILGAVSAVVARKKN